MFKVNNKDTRTTSMTSSIFVVDFDHIAQVLLVFLCCIEQLNVSWVRTHCLKSVQIRSFCWIEYRKIRSRNNSVFGHFLRSDIYFSLRHYRIDIFFSIFGELALISYFTVNICQRIQVIFLSSKFSGNQKLCINWNFISAKLF